MNILRYVFQETSQLYSCAQYIMYIVFRQTNQLCYCEMTSFAFGISRDITAGSTYTSIFIRTFYYVYIVFRQQINSATVK